MLQKKYGVDNLMDWKAQISVGKAKVTVHFTGGALTRFGVTPATFTTKDVFFQRVIENSGYFKEGRIYLMDSVEVPDDAATILRKKREAEKKAAALAAKVAELAASPVLKEEDAAKATVDTAEETGSDTDKQAEEATEQKPEEGDKTEEEPANDGKTKIEVTCPEDAVEYLKQNFSYPSSSLRSKPAIERAAEEHNIEFVGL